MVSNICVNFNVLLFQEIKENADSMLHAEQNVNNELLEQLLLSLAGIEDKTANQSVILADVKTKLKCGLCECVMICPVIVDSGLSFCKSCIEERFKCGYFTCPITKIEIRKHFVINFALQNVISWYFPGLCAHFKCISIVVSELLHNLLEWRVTNL